MSDLGSLCSYHFKQRDQGSSLRGEVVMRIEVDEQQAGFRILRRAAHARI